MDEFLEWLKTNFVNNPVQWFALVVSVVNSIFIVINKLEEKVKLAVRQKQTLYYFSYIYCEKFDCVLFDIEINNTSKSAVTISEIKLTDKNGNTYSPILMEHGSSNITSTDIGELCLFSKANINECLVYEVNKDNLLNNLRLDSYGSIHGLLYFENLNFENYCDNEIFTLKISTPKKCFYSQIVANKLPDNYHPQHPVK